MRSLYYLEHPFLMTAAFFDSIIQKTIEVPRKFNVFIVFAINMLFNFCFSFAMGIVLSIVLIPLLMATSKSHDFSNTIAFTAIPLFLFTCFSSIILLNGRDKLFSLPWCMYIFYGMFLATRPKKHIIQTIIFLVFVTFILAFILILFFSVLFHPTEESAISLVIFTLSIAFIITVLLYSYGSLDDLTRVRRQFLLWFIILFGVLFYSALQLKINLDEPFSNQIHINSVLLLLTFIFSMITVVDKGIELFKLLLQYYSGTMEEIWNEYTSKYGFEVFYNKLIQTRDQTALGIEWTKFFWRTGAVNVIIQNILYVFVYACVSGVFIYSIMTNKVNVLLSYAKSTTLDRLSLSGEQMQHFLIFIASIAFLLWNIYSIRLLKKSNWVMRHQIIGRIFISTIIFLAVFTQTGLGSNTVLAQVLYYVMIAFLIWILTISIVHKVYKIIQWMNHKDE